MNRNQIIAAVCCALYIVLFLVLPFLKITVLFDSETLSAVEMISSDSLMILPVVAGVAMAVCCLLLPKAVSAAVCGVGAFLPLLLYAVDENVDILAKVAAGVKIASCSPGVGVFLCMVLGIVAGLLCLFPDGLSPRKPRRHEPGLGEMNDDNW